MKLKILSSAALAVLLLAGVAAAQSPLCTTFASNNQFAGNMFDVQVTTPVTITSFDVNTTGVAGSTLITVEVYYRMGSYVGFESDPTGWMLIGTDTTTTNGQNTPTNVNIGGVTLMPGQVYGMYVNLASYASGVQALRYTNGNNVYSNAEMTITTGVGKGNPAFTGSTFSQRTWNGCIYYSTAGGFSLSVTGTCPLGGTATASVTGATADGSVAFAYSFTLGTVTVSGGGCASVTLGITNPVLVGVVQADAQGNASLSGPAPAAACGNVHVQAVDLGTCTASNVVSYN